MPKKKKAKKKLRPKAGWDLYRDGVTQSLLNKFTNDTERFHIRTVQGLKPIDRKEAMEYGSLFHHLVEVGSLQRIYSHAKMTKYFTQWVRHRKYEDPLLARIALLQYQCYRDWDKKLPKYKWIDTEPVFNEPYELPPTYYQTPTVSVTVPPGIIIPLRGRIDGVIEHKGKLWIVEYKTKSRINLSDLEKTIPGNIQVMFYALCASLKYGQPIGGVIYNIIRKPQLVQRKGRTTKDGTRKGAETDSQYLKRIKEDIEDNPTHYFTRFEYQFGRTDLKNWIRKSLNPLLYQIFVWWESIKDHPSEPWEDADGNANPFHGQKSWGVFDPLSVGVGDYYRLLTTGSKVDLVENHQQFPELEDHDEQIRKLMEKHF